MDSNMSQSSAAAQGVDRRGDLSDRHYSMYRACLRGDFVAAEMLLEADPKLGSAEINEEGDRALHVAASMKHRQLLRKLVEKLSPSELALLDGRGYTACCYAAIAGAVDIVDLMITRNPSLATARDGENMTPLKKAALRRNEKMVLYFLKSAKAQDLSVQEWFDLLLVTIRGETYGAALNILGINEELATMTNEEGTPLHLLAKQCFFLSDRQYQRGVMQREMRLLAEKLLASIQRLGQSNALALLKNPLILHDAAKFGNIQLITMLTHEYPDLVWLTNDKGYTIFHIAVIYRKTILFGLIDELGARKDFITIIQDENGNNILHLAGELPDLQGLFMWLPCLIMQKELIWFDKVWRTVPPVSREMKNKDGDTPWQLFLKRHKKMLEESYKWMERVSDSCKLIATLIFTVAFGFAFAVPGGYDSGTGFPVLQDKTWFTIFVVFDGLALLSSALSVLSFTIISLYGMDEGHFIKRTPKWFLRGLGALSISVVAAISTFVSAFGLIYFQKRWKPMPMLIIVVGYALIGHVIGVPTYILSRKLYLRKSRWRTNYSLFKGPHVVTKRRCWYWNFSHLK